jgi:acyl dehydratase
VHHLDTIVGHTAAREVTATPEMIESCVHIIGGHNPLPFDAEFTSNTRFGRLIVENGIATGPLHARVAMAMPGAAPYSQSNPGHSISRSTPVTRSAQKELPCLSTRGVPWRI